MQFLKECSATIDRQIEREKLWTEYNKLETFEQRKEWWEANKERINSHYDYPLIKPSYLQVDYEASGYQGVNKGNMGS